MKKIKEISINNTFYGRQDNFKKCKKEENPGRFAFFVIFTLSINNRIPWYESHLKINGMRSHNNSCFQCNIAITNFLVSNTCEIRFHDVIGQSTVHMYMYSYAKNSETWLTYMAKRVCFGPLFFQLNSLDSVMR